MLVSHRLSRQTRRKGAAVVELAILLPLLVFLLLIAIDYCRIFYYSQIVATCARNGAIWECDPYGSIHRLYPDLDTAAKADAPDEMKSSMTVTSEKGSDANGAYVRVTVTYPFKSLTSFPGLPNNVNLTRTVQTGVAPQAPN